MPTILSSRFIAVINETADGLVTTTFSISAGISTSVPEQSVTTVVAVSTLGSLFSEAAEACPGEASVCVETSAVSFVEPHPIRHITLISTANASAILFS